MRAQFQLIIKYVAGLHRSTQARRIAGIKYANWNWNGKRNNENPLNTPFLNFYTMKYWKLTPPKNKFQCLIITSCPILWKMSILDFSLKWNRGIKCNFISSFGIPVAPPSEYSEIFQQHFESNFLRLLLEILPIAEILCPQTTCQKHF